ncbi:hypothetical protein Q5O12_27320, partial [Klebsiella pneumoniae]|uniref:hypothetical protein n=1 Tax=Klebsiella pneumoniae TaxID=573 RepID=UPI00273014BA
LDRFLKEISQFNQQIDRLLPPSQRASLEPLLVQYRDQFQRLVDAYVQLGLTEDTGLMGQMRQAVKSTDELQIELEEHLNHRMER